MTGFPGIDGLPEKPAGSRWTDGQWRAIVRRDRNLLVAAAAGSGKTAVLVERIIRRVSDESDPVDVDRLLVATFTKAAASEMRHRIGEALEEALFKRPESDHLRKQLALLNRASITTLHSFCMEVIRRYFHLIDLDPGFRVADDTEAALLRQEELEALLEERYGEAPEEHPFWTLAEWFGGDRSDAPLLMLIERLYESACSHPFPSHWLQEMAAMYAVPHGMEELEDVDQADRLLAEHPWFASLLRDVRLELAGVSAMLAEGLRLCGLPGGPAPYEGTLADEREMLRRLELAADTGWNSLHQAFQSVAFGKLKPCKADSCDKVLQEQVKKLRTDAKARLDKLQKELFVRRPADYFEELWQMQPLIGELVALTEEFTRRYRLAKREKGLLDFTDLEHMCLAILGRPGGTEDGAEHKLVPTEAALAYREQFVEIMLDEYQDTNLVQETIVELIANPAPGNRFMVGDVKQSIYRFRLAEPGLFLAKYARYRTDSGLQDDGERIDLAQNFRSRRQVVDAVNDIFRRVMRQAVGEMDYTADAELVCGASYPEQSEATVADGGSDEACPDEHMAELVLIDKEDAAYGGGSQPAGDDGDGGEDGSSEGALPTGDGAESPANSAEELEELQTAQLEARYIGRRIRQMMGLDSGKAFSVTEKNGTVRPAQFRDFVILLRATRSWGPVLIEELAGMGIPAYADIQTGYFAATEVETVLSLLKVIDNPRQDIPLAAVLRSPIVGLSAEELAQVRIAERQGDFYGAVEAWLHQAGERLRAVDGDHPEHRAPDIWLPPGVEAPAHWNEAAAAAELPGDRQFAMAHKLLAFQRRLTRWRQEARQGALSELIGDIYRETGYYDYAGGLPGGAQRQANLQALYDRSRQYEATSFRGLFRFLRFVERMQDNGGDLGTARALGEQEDVVRIMSIHKSKGLEFPVVFVAGVNKTFNLMDLNGSFLIHKELGFGARYMDTKLRAVYPTLPQLAIRRRMRLETLAEEMRVLYVALTRAKEKLILTGTAASLSSRVAAWSRGSEGDQPQAVLPDHILAGARTYLDWMMPALLQHPGLSTLLEQQKADGEGQAKPEATAAAGPWQFRSLSTASLSAASAAAGGNEAVEGTTEEIVEAVRTLSPVQVPVLPAGIAERLEEQLEWSYSYSEAAGMLTKTSVSELKRLAVSRVLTLTETGFEWDVPLLPLVGEKPLRPESAASSDSTLLYRLPRFRKARKLTAAETGTIYHTVMQHMPVGSGLDVAEIATLMDGMVDRKILAVEERAEVKAEVIAAFYATEIGKRYAGSEEVRRELPFSFGLRAVEVYPDCGEAVADEVVLIQGVIDCLFEDEQGKLVLLDYKTDRTSGLSVGELANRYRLQLDLYARAVERIWKRKVDERIVFYFDGAHIVHM